MNTTTVYFGGKSWYVIKNESGKILLIGNGQAGNYFYRASDWLRYNTNCVGYFEECRRYLNVDFCDSTFSEEEKKHIIVVENNYPTYSSYTDDLGFKRDGYAMQKKKDRVFPAKVDDLRGLTSRELYKIQALDEIACTGGKTGKVILLPSTIDSKQTIPTISYYTPWNSDRAYDGHKIDSFEYNTLRGYESDSEYDFFCMPCIWVDSSTNLREY